jgi:hypothetical protein
MSGLKRTTQLLVILDNLILLKIAHNLIWLRHLQKREKTKKKKISVGRHC